MENEWEDDSMYESMLSQMISETFDSISTRLKKALPNIRQRFEKYHRMLNKEVPPLSELKEDRTCDKKDLRELMFKRRGAFIVTKYLMNDALMLYALELTGLAIIELHGFLEHFLVRDVPRLLARSKEDVAILRKHLFKNLPLAMLSEFLKELKIWDTNDLTFVHELSGLRNAFAHKNVKKLVNILQLEETASVYDMDSLMAPHTCISYMVRTINLFNKIHWYLKTKDLIDDDRAAEEDT